MKKILLSLLSIGIVAVVAVYATNAFFSDTETSPDNRFTAGAIDLEIDYEGYYNKAVDGNPNAGKWSFKNLTSEKFFDFDDVKPGDFGEGTISIHVFNNDAWACVTIDQLSSLDNSCTEPEGVAEGGPCGSDGELANNLFFTAWMDNGNNIWDENEPLLFANQYGPASDVLNGRTYAFADSTTGGGPLLGSHDYFIGIKWCAGAMEIIPETGVIACDGSSMGNESQTDSVTANISFYVEQSRNNPNFVCPVEPAYSLTLENKDQNYNRLTDDGRYGVLTWAGDGLTFDYDLEAWGLPASTEYSLLYYADGWPGNNPGYWFGNATSDGSGYLTMSGNPDLGMDLPDPADANSPGGAKIWLIPSSAYNSGSLSVTTWPFADDWLFESNLITYDDTDI
jgi:predicted ribosomally synthesized peptide with SipW-like signal peptide